MMRTAVCKREVVAMYRRDGSSVVKLCGTSFRAERLLCEPCTAEYERKYPQGWRYYPGDTCRHGQYVGGCGADLMCGYCEEGE